jgi:predicted transcriptional regulator
MGALRDSTSDFRAFRDELNAKLDESVAAADRGDVISGEQLEAELDEWAQAVVLKK